MAAVLAAVVISCVTISGPKKAEAVLGVDIGDTLSIPTKSFTDTAQKLAHTGMSFWGIPVPFTSLDSIMKLAVKRIITDMQKNVVAWVNGKVNINGVFQTDLSNGRNGNPLYETNPSQFLTEVHDKTAAQYIQQLKDSNQVCDYFKQGLISGLTQEFNPSGGSASDTQIPPVTNLQTGNPCTLSSETQGKLDAYFGGDFIGGGGWDTWLQLTQVDANNPMGAYLTQHENLSSQIQQQQTLAQKELDQGQGFHSVKDANGLVTTPGRIVADQLSFTLTSDMRQLENAKNFDDIVTTLTNSLISKVISNAGGLLNADLSKLNPDNYLKPDYQSATNNNNQGPARTSNVAAQGTAVSSPAVTGGNVPHTADVALTGSYNRNPDYGVFISKKTDNPWWQVDLGEKKPIIKIVVVPPQGNDYPLTNFYVCVSKWFILNGDTDCSGTADHQVWRSELIKTSNNAVVNITPPDGTLGQYVRVQMIGQGVNLALAGVEIYSQNLPIITLVGASEMIVARNSQFTDPSATAIDEKDGLISTDIKVTGSVNTAVAGTYTLHYNVKNSDGIPAQQVTRTVVVQ